MGVEGAQWLPGPTSEARLLPVESLRTQPWATGSSQGPGTPTVFPKLQGQAVGVREAAPTKDHRQIALKIDLGWLWSC